MNLMKTTLLATAIVVAPAVMAQSIVHGTIVDSEGSPLTGVNIHITQGTATRGGATSDAHGEFHFHLDRAGKYRFTFSFIGFQSQVREIEVDGKNKVQLGKIMLTESSEVLQSVEIVGRMRKDYISDYSFSATKLPIKNKDLPQTVTTITKELIKDRQAYQLSEAVKGASSVSQVGPYNHFNIRGITQNQQGQIVNGMRTHQYYFLQPLTQNIERVEVIKGPGSITLSSTDPGGSINLVTKKPLKETRREVNLGVGSFSTIRGGLDFTGPLTKDETVLYRLNIAVQKAKSFRDLVRNDGLLISPSISYIPNDKTAINLELIYSDNNGTLDRGQPVFGKVSSRSDLLSTPISTNLGAAGDHYRSTELSAITSFSQKLSDRLTFTAQYMKHMWDEDLEEHRTGGLVVDTAGNKIPNLIEYRYVDRKQHWSSDNLNAYLSYNYALGKSKHTLLAGYDLDRLNKGKGNHQLQARGYQTNADGSVVTENYNGIIIKKPKVGYFDIYNLRTLIANPDNYQLSASEIPNQVFTTHGAYVQNLSHIGNWTVLLSLRHEWFKDAVNYKTPNESVGRNKVLLPRIGVSYAINKAWSLYGTYLEGFQPQVHAQDMLPTLYNMADIGKISVTHYKPMRSNLIEFGAKAELFGGKIKSNLSFFQIEQKNVLTQVEDNTTESGYRYVERGSDRSRGIEWELSGYVLPALQISASYSFIDAKIKEDPRTELVGQRKEGTAKHIASLWGKYTFDNHSPLKGLSIGAGVLHSGNKIALYDRSLKVPSYTVVDAVANYQPSGSRLELSIKLNNVLNSTYWTGGQNAQRMFPGAPRNFIFSTTYRF